MMFVIFIILMFKGVTQGWITPVNMAQRGRAYLCSLLRQIPYLNTRSHKWDAECDSRATEVKGMRTVAAVTDLSA